MTPERLAQLRALLRRTGTLGLALHRLRDRPVRTPTPRPTRLPHPQSQEPTR